MTFLIPGGAMAKYKHFSYDQGVMTAVNFNNQIVEGSIEYTINRPTKSI